MFLVLIAFLTTLFCPMLVCFYFLICIIIILEASLYSNERERKGMDLGRWESGEALGVGGNQNQNILHEKKNLCSHSIDLEKSQSHKRKGSNIPHTQWSP